MDYIIHIFKNGFSLSGGGGRTHTAQIFCDGWFERSVESRLKIANKINVAYPHSIPVIVLPLRKSDPELSYYKFIIKADTSFLHIMCTIRSRINKASYQRANVDVFNFTLFFKKNIIPQMSRSISHYADSQLEEDGFVYLYYGLENTFG